MKQPTKRQQLALDFLKQFVLLQRQHTDERGWLMLKMGLDSAAALRLIRSLDDFRSDLTPEGVAWRESVTKAREDNR